ncbi:hypothetical protein [Aquimarina hainanensis]
MESLPSMPVSKYSIEKLISSVTGSSSTIDRLSSKFSLTNKVP